MPTVRLLYFSKASRDMSLADLSSILETARQNNQEQNICGMLCYERRYFLQCLEGERSAVNELYLDIADDPRHDEITIVSYEEIPETEFSQWQMGYAGSSAEFNELLSEMGQQAFSPDDLKPELALDFLRHMSGKQQEI